MSTTTPEPQPLLLNAVESVKSWGAEQWLNSTRPEAPATVANLPGEPTLAAVLDAEPAMLGDWSRRLYGEGLPIFTKIIRTDFPPLVHVGFRRAVDRATLLGWLEREQALLGQLFAALAVETRAELASFQSIYAAWATAQALARWQTDDELALAGALSRYVRPAEAPRLAERLGALRRNRAQLVDALNEIDLRREEGNLLLTSAGILHAIFGLSHQTHPLDRTRPALESLFARARELGARGGGDDRVRALVDAADLPALRAGLANAAPPKNEAWLPAMVGGQLVLIEPQQTSDTTYSVADFYTPFVWDERVRFRKGHPEHGLAAAVLAGYLDGLELGATRIDELRRPPVLLAPSDQARLYRLVDEPSAWPFFTAYRLDLDGKPSAPARFLAARPAGVFQQWVVLDGEVELGDEHGHSARLARDRPAFLPATLGGGVTLETRGSASLLLFSVPTPSIQ